MESHSFGYLEAAARGREGGNKAERGEGERDRRQSDAARRREIDRETPG